MARPFQIVDDKVAESDFFLEHLQDVDFDLGEGRHYFSAFLSASRSVTLALQASLRGVDGFDDWYLGHAERLKNDRLARFFHQCRNASLHVGLNFICAGYSDRGRHYLFFGNPDPREVAWVPEEDVVTCCRYYMTLLCSVVSDCYERFALVIDPEAIYTTDGLKALGRTVEDVEEELGFPRGWTSFSSAGAEVRLRALKRHVAMSAIKPVLRKYAPPRR